MRPTDKAGERMKEDGAEEEEEEEEAAAGRRCLTSCPPMLISHGLNRQHKRGERKISTCEPAMPHTLT